MAYFDLFSTQINTEGIERNHARVGNIVFAGSLLAGTALADIPFMNVTAVLFQIFSSVIRFTAKTPIADALIALVPGLRAMSRVGNNTELLSLQKAFSERQNEPPVSYLRILTKPATDSH